MSKSDKVIQQEAECIRKFVNEENTAELTYKQKDAIKFAIQAIIKNDKRGDLFFIINKETGNVMTNTEAIIILQDMVEEEET